MNSPVVWIVFPAITAIALFFVQRKQTVVTVIGTTVALLLGLLALIAPFGESVDLGPVSFELQTSLDVFGRRFLLDSSDRFTLVLIYVGVAFWFAGSLVAQAHRLFVPLGLAIATLLTSALAVEPFLYAALLIELMVLVSIPMLSPPGNRVGRGVLRYLTFQTFGFPLILFTGWLLSGVEAGIADAEILRFAFILLAFGFVFLLGIFPFHTWIPMLSRESHPYVVAFLFFELPLVITLFALGFLFRYEWLRFNPDVYALFALVGGMMIFIGGGIAAFQRTLGGLLGYTVMVEIGLSLLAISLGLGPDGNGTSLGLFFALLLPRAISLGVWTLSLIVISKARLVETQHDTPPPQWELSFKEMQGAARQYPIAAFCLLLAQFSLAGLPLLAGFPIRLALWDRLAQVSFLMTMVVLLGYGGLMIGGIRTMAVLVTGPEGVDWKMHEHLGERLLLIVGGVVIILIGLFPQAITPILVQMADVFYQIVP